MEKTQEPLKNQLKGSKEAEGKEVEEKKKKENKKKVRYRRRSCWKKCKERV